MVKGLKLLNKGLDYLVQIASRRGAPGPSATRFSYRPFFSHEWFSVLSFARFSCRSLPYSHTSPGYARHPLAAGTLL